MDEETLNQCFDLVLELTRNCGTIVSEAASKAKTVESKSNRRDFVTEYDKKVEEILVSGIKAKYPSHKFIAEESSYGSVLPELTDDPTWIIDPIDGTVNFVRNIKLICISIGLAVNKKLVASICYNPCMDEMYTAKKGMGAYLNGERIHTSPCTKFEDSIFAFIVIPRKAERHKIYARSQAFLSRSSPGYRVFGSVAITLCYIASGIMDAYNVEGVGPWDSAGGILLIEEAGGCVKDVSGGDYDIMKPQLVCASTEELCNEMLEIIKEVDSKFDVK